MAELADAEDLKSSTPRVYGFEPRSGYYKTMSSTTNEAFNKAWAAWKAHKMKCAGCKSKNVCDTGAILRDATLRTVRVAKYVEG